MGKQYCSIVMHTHYQLCEIADFLRYSTKLPVKKSVIYRILIFYHALNCSHYKRIMIQRLRQYLDKYAFMQRATMLVAIPDFPKFPNFMGYRLCCFRIFDSDTLEDIGKIHRKLFRSGDINSIESSQNAYLNVQESSHAETLLKRNQDACILVMEAFSTFL
ncbi:hypothetical protein T10_7640 [Trichinella papuae]|uniref:Uncharacterized protein n=1 Tax=Trichinella papuae TaxID=268474 RepID=A0A0V1MTL0_9BILA|nr:hypothetical protein T10_7640 [Trichinella papuae]